MAVISTIVLSFIGILLAIIVNLPLPFLLGPLLILSICSIVKIRLVNITAKVYKPVFFMLGVYLGSTILSTTQNIDYSLVYSILYMLFFNLIAVIICAWYFIKFAKYNKIEAIFAALPGLLAYIVSYCSAKDIAFEKVAIPHTIRVIIIVVLIPIVYSLLNTEIPSTSVIKGLNIQWEIPDIGVLTTIAVIGVGAIPLLLIFKKLNIVNFHFLAGMLSSGVFYYIGIVDSELPNLGLQIILAIIGIMIGTRLAQISHKKIISYSLSSIISTIILLILTLFFAYIGSLLFTKNFMDIILAYAPGGVHEMVLIAIVYNIDPLFVTAHHITRIVSISLCLPFISQLVNK